MLINLINTSLNTLTNYLFIIVGALHRLRIIVLFARIVALTRACRALSCALFRMCHACHSHALSHAFRVCRATSARDDKLFLLIITYVNNVKLLGHIVYVIYLTFARLTLLR